MTLLASRTRLLYPTHNSLLIPLEFSLRYVDIVSRRSIADDPISLEAFLKAPFRRRGVTLLKAIEDGQEKQFYLECCKGGHQCGLRFVLLDPAEPDDSPEPVSEAFAPTIEDRKLMVEIAEYLTIPEGFALAVQAVL